MKKTLSLLALAAVALVSCQKESIETSPLEGDTHEVTFRVAVPEEPGTKAEISDGTKATTLYVAVYYNDSHLNMDQTLPITVGQYTDVTITLVKNIPYDIVFWAQDTDCKAYTLNKDAATLTVSYEGNANDDTRDAFYKVVNDYKYGESLNREVVELRRPFAQINFGATDYSYFEELQVITPALNMTSTIAVSGLPNVLNLLDGTVSGDVATNLVPTAIPNDNDEVLEVNGTNYDYMSMNYVLAPTADNEKLATVKATFTYSGSDVVWDVTDVPYRRNWRTNIIGNLFTENVTFKVIIIPAFTDDFPTIDPEI